VLASDASIAWMLKKGYITILPRPTEDLFQPASLDVHLDRYFRTINRDVGVIDPAIDQPDMTILHEIQDDEAYLLRPHEFVLASTLQHLSLNDAIAAEIDGRSSIGRLGVLVHATAGWIDPGFQGFVTLEIVNLAPVPVKLYPGMRIAQLVFSSLHTPSNLPYGASGLRSSYQNQPRGPVPSAVARTWNPISTRLEGEN